MNPGPSNDRFLKACCGEPVDCTPVWFMRQAGRYMPEYRKIREQHSLLEICKIPELCAQVTLQPIEKLGVDAAILFSDIMLPLGGMGVEYEFKAGVGPIIHNPIRGETDVNALRVIEPEADLLFVLEAIRMLREAPTLDVPLIGFSGAPFTLASYMIEGGPPKNFSQTKRMMYQKPALWHLLLEKLSEVVVKYLRAQIRSGVQAVQLFDSWVGCLSPQDYQAFVLPHSRRIFQGLEGMDVPCIHFGTGTATLLTLISQAGGDVIGVDWRIPLDQAWVLLGEGVGIQGNLDPAVLLGPFAEVEKRTTDILKRAKNRPGHIFNLGHGVLPDTPVDHVARLVEVVHEQSRR
ncbi:MAG: uroporphyrinogen decarboxylase [Candidatus Bipolaricaulia bacterium]